MVYFEVVNKPRRKGDKFQTVNYKAAEAERDSRQRAGIACIIQRRRVRET